MRTNSVFVRGLKISIPFFAVAVVVSLIISYFTGDDYKFYEKIAIPSGIVLPVSFIIGWSGKARGEYCIVWAGKQLVAMSSLVLLVCLYFLL